MDGEGYHDTTCTRAAGAFLEDLEAEYLPSLKLTINDSGWHQEQDYSPRRSKVDIRELLWDAAEAGGGGMLRSLSLYGVLQFEGVIPALVAAPVAFWENLKDLEISYGYDNIGAVLQAATHFSKLERLSIIFSTVSAMPLLHAEALHELRIVRVVCSEFDSFGSKTSFMRAVRGCELLEELWLDAGDIDGAALLETLASLRNLRVLALTGHCDSVYSETLARIVVDWPHLDTLILESVFEGGLPVAAAQILGGATRQHLRVLSITSHLRCEEDVSGPHNKCMEALLGSGTSWMGTLEELHMEIDDEACVRALIAAAPRLRTLAVQSSMSSELQLAAPTLKVLSTNSIIRQVLCALA